MKFKVIFFSTLLLLLISILACNQGEPTTSTDSTIMNTFGVPDSCLIEYGDEGHEGGEKVIYRIVESCAIEYINDYDEYINSVKTVLVNDDNTDLDTSKLVYGQKVGIHELRVLLHHAELQDYHKFYAMLGIINDTTKLIFALEDTTDADKPDLFFDFTMPCPTGCPKNFPYTN